MARFSNVRKKDEARRLAEERRQAERRHTPPETKRANFLHKYGKEKIYEFIDGVEKALGSGESGQDNHERQQVAGMIVAYFSGVEQGFGLERGKKDGPQTLLELQEAVLSSNDQNEIEGWNDLLDQLVEAAELDVN